MANSFDDEKGNPLGGVLRAAIGLTPIGIAAAVGFQRIQANAALNPLAAVTGGDAGALKEIARPVGKLLRESARNDRVEQLSFAEKTAKDITQSDAMQKLFSEVEQQRALVQSILDVMDDPSLGFDQNQLTGYREKLVDLSREAISSDDAEEAITSIVRAINDQGSGDVKARWAQNLREYQKLSPYLAPPTLPLEAGQRYNPIPASSLKGKAASRYKYLLEQGVSSRQLRVVEFQQGTQKQFYAKFFSSSPDRGGSFQALIPLDYAAKESGYISAMEGEHLATGYTASKHHLNAEAAQRVVDRAGGFTVRSAEGLVPNPKVSINAMRTSGEKVFMDLEDIFIRGLFDYGQVNDKGRFVLSGRNAREYGAYKRQFMSADNRVVSSGKAYAQSGGMVGHLRSARAFDHNYVYMHNLPKAADKRNQFIQNMGVIEGADPGIPGTRIMSDLLPLPGEDWGAPIAQIGLRSGSAISQLKTAAYKFGEVPRSYAPAVSRLEQNVGREAMFVTKGMEHRMGRSRTMSAGAGVGYTSAGNTRKIRTARNIDWAESVTGATNKAVLLDVGGRIPGLEGSGVAYHSGREMMRTTYTKPLLDPGANNLGVTGKLFMDEVVGKAKEGEMVRLTRQQIKKYGGFLGLGPAGAQFLKDDPRMEQTWLGFEVTRPTSNKQMVNLIAISDRGMEKFKGFSPLFKGTMSEIEEQRFLQMAEAAGMDAGTMKALNIRRQDLVIAEAGKLKKGQAYLDLQLRSGYGLISGDTNWEQNLYKAARRQVGPTAILGESALAKTTGAVMRELKRSLASGLATEKEIGMVLAGIYQGESLIKTTGLTSGKPGVPGEIEQLAPLRDQSVIRQAITGVFGEEAGARIISSAEKGFALGGTSMVAGAGPGDWARGRGSMEPRSFQVMQRKLRNMGISPGEISNIMADIYRNKVGYAPHLKSATAMLTMAESVSGLTGAIDAADMMRQGVPTLNLDAVREAVSKNRDMSAFLSQYEKGFMLDLTSTETPGVASRAISAAATSEFRQGQVFVPGGEILNSMRQTFIRTMGEDIKVQSEFTQMVSNFFNDIVHLQSIGTGAREEANKSMARFKQDVMQMTSKITHSVLGGKIKGSAFMYGDMYDLNAVGTEFSRFSTKAREEMAVKVWKATKGTGYHIDTKAFLSMLSDYMGSDTGKVTEAARKAERFFTSLEALGKSNLEDRVQGQASFVTRNPVAGLGNIAPGQFYRHVEEVGRGRADEALKKFREIELTSVDAEGRTVVSRPGVETMKKFKVQTFADVKKLSAKDRQQFFKSFVGNLSNFAGIEGGGTTYLPKYVEKANVTMGSKVFGSVDIDFGFSGAMIGDFDGDQYMIQMVNEDSGKTIMSTLTDSEKRAKLLTAENVYKGRSAVFAEAMKRGLTSFIGEEGVLELERQRQDIMKEAAAKGHVGPLDVKLNKIRTALLDLKGYDTKFADEAAEAMSMIHVMQEHAVIKGKKLPTYRPFAESISTAVDALLDHDNFDLFKATIERDIFGKGRKGIDFLEEAMQIDAAGPWVESQRVIPKGTTASIQRAFETIRKAVALGAATNNIDMTAPSIGQLAKMLGDDDLARVEQRLVALRAGEGARGAMVAGYAGDTAKSMAAGAENMLNKISAAAGNMNTKTMGIVAGGLAAGMAAAGLISGGGFSPEPMSVPGEVVSPRVRNAISQGSFFGTHSTGPTPQQMQHPRDHYAMMDRPINVPSSYLNAQTGYKVRGQLSNPTGISALSSYMGALSGGNAQGSIRINDARRPITSNYVDRMLGEY